MFPSSSERRRSTARKLAISAAAIVVTVLPTACGSAYAGSPSNGSGVSMAPGRSGHGSHGSGSSHGGHGAPTETRVVVPAGNTADPTTTPSDDSEEQPETTAPARPGGDGSNGSNGSGDAERSGGSDGSADPDEEGAGGDDGAAEPDKPAPPANNGLDVLGTDCTGSRLPPHDGFQLAPRCVSTSFGEVAAEDKSPSLLITDAPRSVRVKEKFTISVSTRNLVRDRFLGAAAGGYYLESSFLSKDGLQRGHFHTACRMLGSTDVAPDAAPAPEFFLATQDNGGGADPDTVTVTVTGMPTAGTAQCAVWAGDGSHRIPMMQRANQTPAFDAVRITVK
jgi:hypothetical protein